MKRKRHWVCLGFNFLGVSDPYLIISENGIIRAKTISIDNNLNPFWNQAFFLPVSSLSQIFTLRVMDLNENTDDKELGSTDFQVSTIISKENESLSIKPEIEL